MPVSISVDSLLLGESPAMAEVRRLVRQVAPSDASVMITGPSGSGKEVVARAIHAHGGRADQPFVAVNTGAIPRDLLESELFGHEKGSFTGAIAQRQGRFEEAHGGLLFLDEIGDMPIDMQVKLLRVLEERSIQRVGGRGCIAIDTRIVSATHRDIDEAIEAQRFRADLYYRLAVFPIDLPSLAARGADVPLLLRHFLGALHVEVGFSPAAMDLLVAHPWPGNVRELRNVVERAIVLYGGRTVGAEQVHQLLRWRAGRQGDVAAPGPVADRDANALQAGLTAVSDSERRTGLQPSSPANLAAWSDLPLIGTEPVDLRMIVAECEHHYISEALQRADGVVAEAARSLSLQRTTLIEKMRKYGLVKAA